MGNASPVPPGSTLVRLWNSSSNPHSCIIARNFCQLSVSSLESVISLIYSLSQCVYVFVCFLVSRVIVNSLLSVRLWALRPELKWMQIMVIYFVEEVCFKSKVKKREAIDGDNGGGDSVDPTCVG